MQILQLMLKFSVITLFVIGVSKIITVSLSHVWREHVIKQHTP